jgi:hypothetical protein
VGKLDVPAYVPGEAVLIQKRCRQTADMTALLDDREPSMAQFMKTVGGA